VLLNSDQNFERSKVVKNIISLCITFFLCISIPASAQACAMEFKMQKMQMLTLSKQCEAREELIASIGRGENVNDNGACSTPLSVNAQNEAFSECARVYLCAARALACAEKLAAQGTDCRTAVSTCQARNPVPQ